MKYMGPWIIVLSVTFLNVWYFLEAMEPFNQEIFSAESLRKTSFFVALKGFLPKLPTPLIKAARVGNVERVRELLAHSTETLNALDWQGNNALMNAVGYHHVSIVQELIIYYDLDINQKNKKGWTALFGAINKGDTALVELILVRADTDINDQDLKGNTPLMLAAFRGNSAIVKALMKWDILDVNATNQSGETALMIALFYQAPSDLIQALLEYPGIRMDTINIFGGTVLSSIVQKQDATLLDYIREKGLSIGEVNRLDVRGNNPLFYAIERGNLSMIHSLLRIRGIDINVRNGKGETPLMRATYLNEEAIRIELLRYGGDI